MARVIWLHSTGSTVGDFYYFWDAARHVLRGEAAQVYVAHATPAGPLEPLAYPPPFLLLVAPFGLIRYGASLVLWLTLTGFFCLLAARQPVRLALVHPPTAYNVQFGQTAFLTSAMLLGGANRLDRRPLVAGALLGLLVVKPHLGLLLPVALAAGRKWASLVAAAVTAVALTALAAITFGPGIYRAWWAAIPQYGNWLVTGFWRWNLLASVYGVLRWADHGVALAVHVLVAVAAALIVFKAWRQNWDSKVPVLAAAAVLVPPYLFTYDAVLLVAPFGWLAARQPWRALIVWTLLLVPLLGTSFLSTSLLPLAAGDLPNTTPVAAALSLLFLWMERRTAR